MQVCSTINPVAVTVVRYLMTQCLDMTIVLFEGITEKDISNIILTAYLAMHIPLAPQNLILCCQAIT